MDNPSEKLIEAKSKIEALLHKGMEKALIMIEFDAKQNCPVDTGHLRASIAHKVEENESQVVGSIGSTLEYAPYVHQGTGIYAVNGDGRKDVPWKYRDKLTGEWHNSSGQKPNPFLQKAIDNNKDKIGEIFKEATERIG